ncbi:MAG: flagellar protein [Lachnospiraceae bacterium]|nr:flagellar protein [Lachnospiraceae bacterium]
MKILSGQFPSIEQMTGQYASQGRVQTNGKTEEDGQSFSEILSAKQKSKEEELRFSKHASLRLSDRHIELSDSQLSRLQEGTQKAGEKGINESLVLMDELAFIVNVRNNTVITAMDQNEAGENVFTNIDGAVIV